MNLFIKIIFVLASLTQLSILNAQGIKANLTIQTNVDSARLFIDDNFIGVGKSFEIETDTGIHHLQIVEVLKEWNAEIIKDTIHLKSSDNPVLNYNFKSQILLNTNPEDVRVLENDSLIGFTPILLASGFENLRLEKPDYDSLFITSEEISTVQIPELKFNGEPTKQEFYGSTLFYALLGTAIAFGGVTAYNKLEADNLYEEYKNSSDPGLVDNIAHYDDQSAWTLIAMEICVGAIIYFFITN